MFFNYFLLWVMIVVFPEFALWESQNPEQDFLFVTITTEVMVVFWFWYYTEKKIGWKAAIVRFGTLFLAAILGAAMATYPDFSQRGKVILLPLIQTAVVGWWSLWDHLLTRNEE
jgi:hypothetical protein